MFNIVQGAIAILIIEDRKWSFSRAILGKVTWSNSTSKFFSDGRVKIRIGGLLIQSHPPYQLS